MNHGEDWPGADVLEKWMMELTTAADTDRGHVKMLQKILRSNPGYGSMLVGDKALCSLVIGATKDLRRAILDSEGPVPTVEMYQHLCQFMWCTVGEVLQSVSDLGGKNVHALTLNRKAKGQLRCLLKTNEELSNRLNIARRSYLLELSEHRSRQRQIRPVAERALAVVSEQPIMFYEPLDTVLDQGTKAFVHEVIMERLRLEMSAETLRSQEAEEADALRTKLHEQTHHLAEVEKEMQEMKRAQSDAELSLRRTQRALADAELKVTAFQRQSISNKEESLQHELSAATSRIAELETKLQQSSQHPAQAQVKNLQVKCQNLAAQLEEARQQIALLQEATASGHLQNEVNRLEGELDKATSAAQLLLKAKDRTELAQLSEAEKLLKWCEGYEDLEEKYEDLQMSHSKLEQREHVLVQSLQIKCGKEVVREALVDVDARVSQHSPPAPKSKRKALQQLMDDPQRRLLEVKIKTESLKAEQDRAIKVLLSRTRVDEPDVQGLYRLQGSFDTVSQRLSDLIQRLYHGHVGHGESSPAPEVHQSGVALRSPQGSSDATGLLDRERMASKQFDFEDAVAIARTPLHKRLSTDRLSNGSQEDQRMQSPVSGGSGGILRQSSSKWRLSGAAGFSREHATPGTGQRGTPSESTKLSFTEKPLFRAASSHTLQEQCSDGGIPRALQRVLSRSYGQEGFFRTEAQAPGSSLTLGSHDSPLSSAGRLALGQSPAGL